MSEREHIPAEWECRHCGHISYHPMDRKERYCAKCHHFCEDVDRAK